jgi:hypothetical protein
LAGGVLVGASAILTRKGGPCSGDGSEPRARAASLAITIGEYVSKDGISHVNTADSRFALFKRGVYGTFHNLSEAHLAQLAQNRGPA